MDEEISGWSIFESTFSTFSERSAESTGNDDVIRRLG